MANTFVTPTAVARDAAITLANRLLVGNLVARDKEAVFTGSKRGESISVTIPPAVSEASEFTGSTSAGDVTEQSIDLTLEKHFYKRVDLTSRQKTLELDDFTRTVTVPAIQGIQLSIDRYILKQLQAFRKNLAGTIANRPSTVAHLVAANKVLNDNFVLEGGRIGLVDTTVEAALLQIAQFTSADYNGPDLAAVREANLGRKFGANWMRNASLGAFARGDVAGTVLANGGASSGDKTLAIDGLTEATGTIYAGTVFTVAGSSTRFVVRKDATIASNATTLTIGPAIDATIADDAALTFEAAGYMNLLYHPNAVASAIVAPVALNAGSAVQTFDGISVRVSMDSSIVTLADSVVYDVFVGARVINLDGGCLIAS